MPDRILVLYGSYRSERAGIRLAKFIVSRLRARGADAELIDAKAIGLVSDVFPTEEFDARVLEVAARLAAGPTQAYAVAKSLIHQAAGAEQLDYHLDQELQHLARIADGADYAEGMAAFFEKRAPKFDGRG